MESAKEVETDKQAVAWALRRHVKGDVGKHAQQFINDLWDAGYTLVPLTREGVEELSEFLTVAEEDEARWAAEKAGKR